MVERGLLEDPVPRSPLRLYTCVSSTTSTTSTTSTYRPGAHTPVHQVPHATPVDRYSRSLTASRRGKQPARIA